MSGHDRKAIPTRISMMPTVTFQPRPLPSRGISMAWNTPRTMNRIATNSARSSTVQSMLRMRMPAIALMMPLNRSTHQPLLMVSATARSYSVGLANGFSTSSPPPRRAGGTGGTARRTVRACCPSAPERGVQSGRGRDDPTEKVGPEQQRERDTDRAVRVGLLVDLAGDPVHGEDVEELDAEPEEHG